MIEYIKRGEVQAAMKFVTDDITCPLHIAAEIDQVLSLAPAADVRPERNGEWVHLGGDEWCCSCCDYVISTDSSWEHPMSETRCNDFCSKCGAKMKTPDAET